MNYEPHPASLLFPMMADSELSELAEDIKQNGLLEPIVLFEDKILDGRNRLVACQLAQVEPRFAVCSALVTSPFLYVISKNIHRRHLSIEQRAAIGAEILPFIKQPERPRGSKGEFLPTQANSPVWKSDGRGRRGVVADALGVSATTIREAETVKAHDPEAFDRLKRGESEVHTEYRKVRDNGKPRPAKAPFAADTDRRKKLALLQKERMVGGLSEISGICRALESLDSSMIAAVTSREELETWADKARELSKSLVCFATSLREEMNVKAT